MLDNSVYRGVIAYGRRKTEKIEGTRNEYHIVKQNEYPVYDGIHNAIIDDATWVSVHAKRAENAYRREKIHSKDHEHVLSDILKCWVCGASMYGEVSRKKKKDGSGYYKDIWYYTCKNQKTVTGTKCLYNKRLRQERVDEQVISVLREIISHSDMPDRVAARIGTPDNVDELLKDKVRLEETIDRETAKKAKLLRRIQALDPGDPLYDEMFDSLQEVLREHMETIAGMNENLRKTDTAIQNAAGQLNTAEYVLAYMRTMIGTYAPF